MRCLPFRHERSVGSAVDTISARESGMTSQPVRRSLRSEVSTPLQDMTLSGYTSRGEEPDTHPAVDVVVVMVDSLGFIPVWEMAHSITETSRGVIWTQPEAASVCICNLSKQLFANNILTNATINFQTSLKSTSNSIELPYLAVADQSHFGPESNSDCIPQHRINHVLFKSCRPLDTRCARPQPTSSPLHPILSTSTECTANFQLRHFTCCFGRRSRSSGLSPRLHSLVSIQWSRKGRQISEASTILHQQRRREAQNRAQGEHPTAERSH